MSVDDDFSHRLQTVLAVSAAGELVRVVPEFWLRAGASPTFLYASGKPNRFNLPGVSCVYFSEDEPTALREYLRPLRGTSGELQPRTAYFARISLSNVLDLTDADTLTALGLTDDILQIPWRGAASPTPTQVLGTAVSRQRRVSAIRYRSDAARAAGERGTNIVIFRDAVSAPDFVEILGPGKDPLERWG